MNKRIQQLLSLATVSEAIRQSGIAAFGNIFTGIVAALAIILASRILGPEKFGVFSVATTLILIFCKIGDIGLNSIITRFLPRIHRDIPASQILLKEIFFWKLIALFIGIVILFLGRYQLSNVLNYHYPDLWIWILIGALSVALFEHVAVILSALHEFIWGSALSIIQAILKLLSFIVIGLMGWKSVGLITPFYAIAPAVGVLIVLPKFYPWILLVPKRSGEYWQKIIRRYAGHAAIGLVATTLITNMDILFVQKYLLPFDTGVYAGASRIAQFVTMFTFAVGTVLGNRVAGYQNREDQSKYLRKSFILIVVAALCFAFFVPLARFALIMTVGLEYASGLSVLVILMANAFLSLALTPYMVFFYSLDVPHYFSIGGLLQLLTIVLLNITFLPDYGILVTAYSRLLATIVFGVYTGIMIWHYWGKNRLEPVFNESR